MTRRLAGIALLAVALLAALASVARAQSARSSTLLIRDATVIDGTDAPAHPHWSVLVADGRIAAVGPSARIAAPAGARVIDARGRWVIPGLWDMHVHLWHGAEPFALLVANGVTSVRDMGTPIDTIRALRRRIADGSLLGPHIAAAPGPWLDASAPEPGLGIAVRTPGDAAHAIDSLATLGANFVKIMSAIPRDAYLAALRRAHTRGLVAVGHLPYAVDAIEAADSGQRDLEHAMSLVLVCAYARAASCERMSAKVRATDADSLAAHLVRAGAVVVPTMVQLVRWSSQRDSAFERDARLAHISPARRAEWARDSSLGHPSVEDAARIRDAYRAEVALVRRLHERGVPMLAGTDLVDPYIYPGFSLHDELALLVREVGLTPREALRAATRDAAALVGALDSTGTIERGKAADLVLLGADPLADIANVRRVESVVVGGRLIDGIARRDGDTRH
jgi:hypothetical protein